jgi:hypothetical protein
MQFLLMVRRWRVQLVCTGRANRIRLRPASSYKPSLIGIAVDAEPYGTAVEEESLTVQGWGPLSDGAGGAYQRTTNLW